MSYNGTQADQLFATAVDIVTSRLPKTGSAQVSYSSKLALYALYKQSTEGDVNTSRPGMLDLLGRAKWDAWKQRQGTSAKDAKLLYVENLARILKAAQGDHLSQQLYQELQAQAAQPLASETESESGTESDSNSEHERQQQQQQPLQALPQPSPASLVGAIRREHRGFEEEDERETIAPLPASTLLHESQHSLPSSLPSSSYVALPGGPPRAIRSAAAGGIGESGSSRASTTEQLLSVSSAQLKQEWLAEQQRRSQGLPWPAQATQPQPPPPPPAMTEAHLQAHNRSSVRPAPSPRPPSIRSVPVPLESTLQAIHTSLQALHERISALEAETQRNRARRSPWSALMSRCLYVLTLLWRSPEDEGSGYVYHQQQQQRRPSVVSIFLGFYDQVRDVILVALLVALLLRRRRWLLDWTLWIKQRMPKYRLRLIQTSS